MLLAHAVTLAEARSYLAALADTARTVEGSIAYDRVLLHLDLVHHDESPAHTDLPRTLPGDLLYRCAVKAIEDLKCHGVDALQIELVLAELMDARETDTVVDGGPGTP
ncbi:hypothetical protein NBCG_01620 [Nocardioidaceae bacterium Broad-1]|nr:hypothetical protein NBCG_01620 [Nocardioidaceae bacterium Broad-1]